MLLHRFKYALAESNTSLFMGRKNFPGSTLQRAAAFLRFASENAHFSPLDKLPRCNLVTLLSCLNLLELSSMFCKALHAFQIICTEQLCTLVLRTFTSEYLQTCIRMYTRRNRRAYSYSTVRMDYVSHRDYFIHSPTLTRRLNLCSIVLAMPSIFTKPIANFHCS